LEQRLRPYQDRLPELLERGIDVMAAEESTPPQDESTILEVLTSNPTPAQILALRPSPKLQTRVSELLARSKRDELSRQEEAELDRYLVLEHLVRLAKSRVAQHRVPRP
jgi:hypothetical protein